MKKFLKFVLMIIVLYFLLLIPIPQSQKEVQMASRNPFIWGQDKLWDQLEVSFKNAKEIPSGALDSIVNKMTIETDSIFNENEDKLLKPNDPFYTSIEKRFFNIAPLIAAQKVKSDWYIRFYNQVRKKMKNDSRSWDMGHELTRNLTYRILYGMSYS